MIEKNSALTGGDIVARFLKSVGVTEVYGIPGGHTLGLNEGLVRHKVEFVTFRHEYGAGCAAAAFGRVTERAGVALVTCGPGVTNVATAMAGSLKDGNPLLLLSVNNRSEHIGWGDAQDADAVTILSSISKFSIHVPHIKALLPSLQRAWRIAHSDRPGPVHIDLAREVAEDPLAREFGEIVAPKPEPLSLAAPKPASGAVDAVLGLLHTAKRPVLWIGRGSLPAYHRGQLRKLVDHLGIPVLSTFNAMETACAFGDLSFGVLSRVGTNLTRQILESSDFLLCLGNSLNGVSTKRWSMKIPDFVQVDIRADRISGMYSPRLSVICDVGAFCEALASRFAESPLQAKWKAWLDNCREKRSEWQGRLDQAVKNAAKQPISPIALMDLFARLGLDDGAHWSIDASNPGIWAHMLRFRNNSRVLRPVNFSNMGFALGSAIGMARAMQSKAPVNVLIGDGSMGMSLGELETIRRLQLPVRIFVMNDSSLSNIRQEVTHKFSRNETGFDFTDVRFDKIAEGFGIAAARFESLSALETQLCSEPGDLPRLYDIVIDRSPSVWTDMV